MKTAVAYLRVSTPSQMSTTSMERQFEYCKAWCKDNNVKIIGVITECCSGYSGEHVKRSIHPRSKKAQMGRFLNKLSEGFKTDYLVFEEWDRFSRLPLAKTLDLVAAFRNYGVGTVPIGLGYPYENTRLTEKELYITTTIGYHDFT